MQCYLSVLRVFLSVMRVFLSVMRVLAPSDRKSLALRKRHFADLASQTIRNCLSRGVNLLAS